jgi:hypothetical protein
VQVVVRQASRLSVRGSVGCYDEGNKTGSAFDKLKGCGRAERFDMSSARSLLCIVAQAVHFAGSLFADSYTIGPKGINSAGLPVTGAGVAIGLVEPGRAGDAQAGDDLAHRNTFMDLADVFIRDDPGNPPPNTLDVKAHAQEVAGVMISTDASDGSVANGISPIGVAPGAQLYSSGYVTEGVTTGFTDAIRTIQFIASIPGMRAVNHSWGKEEFGSTFPNDGTSQLTLGVDWSARQHDVLHVVAGNQGTMPDTPLPKDNYNGMTIGRAAKAADGVYRLVSPSNNFAADAFGARTSISLIAPGDDIEVAGFNDAHRVTSASGYAAPHVVGTVALLQQNATTANARRHEVMKAVLLNSADKIQGILGMERTVLRTDGTNWSQTAAAMDPAIPLDIQMGAGHLNAKRAYQQFAPGESNPGGVPLVGWDYHSQSNPVAPNVYSFNQPLFAGDYVSVTLAWDRVVQLNTSTAPLNQYKSGDTFTDGGFANLDIYVLPAGATNVSQAIFSSTSVSQNVEHIFARIPSTGSYVIWVDLNDASLVVGASYGLAWWAGGNEVALEGDFNRDGNVDAADYVMWRKTNGNSLAYVIGWRTLVRRRVAVARVWCRSRGWGCGLLC